MWRILVLLRAKPHTFDELAQKLGVSERTIRRDVVALQQIPLPIECRFPPARPRSPRYGIRAADRQEWFVRAMPAWPDGERAPIADLPDVGHEGHSEMARER